MSNAMARFHAVFPSPKPIIGMVHLPPLPGSPRYNGEPMAGIAEYAVAEARTLESAGFDGLIIENFGDVMFYKKARPETVAALTYVAQRVRSNTTVPIGLCVLQSDGIAAVAIAHVVGAQFVRIPYYTETYVVDAGVMESCAAEVLRFRKFLGANVLIFADVHIKHGYPLAQRPIEESAEDAVHRGLADALIVTGKKTGGPTNVEDIRRVKEAVPDWPVFAGSGVSVHDVDRVLKHADGVIVGTSLKVDGDTEKPLDPKRVEEFVRASRRVRGRGD